MSLERTIVITAAVIAAIVTGLSGCATPGTGISFGGQHNSPAVIMRPEYATLSTDKEIKDNGAEAKVNLMYAQYKSSPEAGKLRIIAKWRITSTGAAPFDLQSGSAGWGYGSLRTYDEATFKPTGAPDVHPASDPNSLLWSMTLKQGEATEGLVEYTVPYTDKPMVLTWSAAGDHDNVLGFWEIPAPTSR